MTIAKRMTVMVVIGLIALAALPAGEVRAANPERTALVIEAPTKGHEGITILSAVLTGADGRPRPNQRVEFYLKVDVLGATEAFVGYAITDGGGAASVPFRVTVDGPHEFTAKYAGTAELAASESKPATYDLVVLEAERATERGSRAGELNRVGRWVPWSALALGIGVWIALLMALGRVVLLVPAEARRHPRSTEIERGLPGSWDPASLSGGS